MNRQGANDVKSYLNRQGAKHAKKTITIRTTKRPGPLPGLIGLLGVLGVLAVKFS
jgi:hypothetical protein